MVGAVPDDAAPCVGYLIIVTGLVALLIIALTRHCGSGTITIAHIAQRRRPCQPEAMSARDFVGA